jgi:hypothetical protein
MRGNSWLDETLQALADGIGLRSSVSFSGNHLHSALVGRRLPCKSCVSICLVGVETCDPETLFAKSVSKRNKA